MNKKEEIRKDILAFADDESEVLIEPTGAILFYKNGTEQLCYIESDNGEGIKVKYNEEILTYNEFISKKLARLDIFAQKIKEKRKKLDAFIDGPAYLHRTTSKDENGNAMQLLKKECDSFLEFGSKINFITADAGHGKSILLKQFQYEQAERYSKKESSYLFWHIDLQGRDLVRLGEAIMYDLGELRMPGLYYPSIVNLIQKKMIILAIDGFDELAAEIGGVNAVSSLSNFINEMDGSGTLICASRRTFFDTGDYLNKTNIINRDSTNDIFFNELKLKDWGRDQVISYFDILKYKEPETIYKQILCALQEDKDHPILTRPFLLAKLEQSLENDSSRISNFFSNRAKTDNGVDDGVSLIVETFTRREVDKWKERNATNNETGKPYLSYEQHIELLSTIAKEMWESKKDYVTKEEIELYTILLTEQWKIPKDIEQKIVRTATFHAFLIPKDDSKRTESRKFDHEEFRFYFLSRALAKLIDLAIEKQSDDDLKRFLYKDQIPDSVALHCFNYVKNKSKDAEAILKIFSDIINKEWKPTCIQINIGTLVPFLLHNLNNKLTLKIKSKIEYSSLIFESKNIKNVVFEDGFFINISFRNTSLENVQFVNCEFNEIKFENKIYTNDLKSVSFVDCQINSIIVLEDGETMEMIYAPQRINFFLQKFGVSIYHLKDIVGNEENDTNTKKYAIYDKDSSLFKKTLLKFILKYNQQTVQYEKNIIEDKYISEDTDLVIKEIIPILEKYNVITSVQTSASKQMRSKAWRLLVNIEKLLSADKDDKEDTSNKYYQFWKEVNNYKGHSK